MLWWRTCSCQSPGILWRTGCGRSLVWWSADKKNTERRCLWLYQVKRNAPLFHHPNTPVCLWWFAINCGKIKSCNSSFVLFPCSVPLVPIMHLCTCIYVLPVGFYELNKKWLPLVRSITGNLRSTGVVIRKTLLRLRRYINLTSAYNIKQLIRVLLILIIFTLTSVVID